MDAKGEKGGVKDVGKKEWITILFVLRQTFLIQPRLTWNFRFSGYCFLRLCLQADRIK